MPPRHLDRSARDSEKIPSHVLGETAPQWSNYLHFRLNPEVVLALSTRKVPGEQMVGEEVELCAAPKPGRSRAVQALLGDAIDGDQTLFTRQDSVEAAWRVVDPVLGNATPLHLYEPGTWGPPDADGLIDGYGPGTIPRRQNRRIGERVHHEDTETRRKCETRNDKCEMNAQKNAPAHSVFRIYHFSWEGVRQSAWPIVRPKTRQSLDQQLHHAPPLLGRGGVRVARAGIGRKQVPGAHDRHPAAVDRVEFCFGRGTCVRRQCAVGIAGHEFRSIGHDERRLHLARVIARVGEDSRSTSASTLYQLHKNSCAEVWP